MQPSSITLIDKLHETLKRNLRNVYMQKSMGVNKKNNETFKYFSCLSRTSPCGTVQNIELIRCLYQPPI